LTADDWAQILDEVRPHVHRIKLTGGEPTSHPQFRAIARRAADLGVPFTLFTHGHWHQPQRMIRFLADLPAFDGLLVSLHGPDPARHEAFTRTPGSFVRVLATVQAAAEAGLHISLSCVLTHHNWNRVAAMPSLARRIGAHEIVFNRYIGPAISGLTASRQELQAALHEVGRARARGEPVKFGNCVPTCFQPTGQAACLAGRAFLTIDPWGRARPCNHARLVCGNLLHQSLEDIWSSPGLNLWRGWEPTQCKACAAFSACRGGCQAQARALGLEADPLTGTPFPLADEPHTNELILFERARPVGRFSRQPQAFGSLLLAGNRLFPVGREMQGVLDTLDGSRTLEEIGAFHGPRGLGLVGSLYQAGMVELLA
jgi:radical SAM protein with 4Fe4S-binding SPASM domain